MNPDIKRSDYQPANKVTRKASEPKRHQKNEFSIKV